MPKSTDFLPNTCYDLAAQISSGQTASQAIDLSGTCLFGLFVPAGFTGTTIQIQAATSPTGAYSTVQDGSGNDYSLPVAAGKFVPISNIVVVAGLRFVKLVSGTNEVADRVIPLATGPLTGKPL